MRLNCDPAPTPGQDDTLSTRAPQALDNSSATATAINVSQENQTHLDVRIRDRFVRYTSDPTSGLWRTYGDCPREHISPFALTRIDPGRGSSVEIAVTEAGTGVRRTFEGDLDMVASALWRAGQGLGCRAERKLVYWAIREFTDRVRRQQAARGVEQ